MNKSEDSSLLVHPKQEEFTMTGSVTMWALDVLSWDNDSKANKKIGFSDSSRWRKSTFADSLNSRIWWWRKGHWIVQVKICAFYFKLHMTYKDILACFRLIFSEVCIYCIFLLKFSSHMVDWGCFDYWFLCYFLRRFSFLFCILIFCLFFASNLFHYKLKHSSIKDCCFKAGSYSDLSH